MSFTRLLAAGQSIIGIKKQRGPFKMNPDSHLPHFAPVYRSTGSAAPIPAKPCEPAADPTTQPAVAVSGPAAEPAVVPVSIPRSHTPVKEPKVRLGFRTFLAQLAIRLARMTTPQRATPGAKASSRARIRVELSLDQLKVVCNDLSDSDFEVLKARKRPVYPSEQTKNTAKAQPLGMVWNRLSARLLRQAAQEFNLVQKERGKLLSQAGHGQTSARDS